jgi:hypothetical protein
MTVEVDGMLWKPRPGATASAVEFTQARSLMMEILALEAWNPWVIEDRAQEYEAAMAVFGQWTRAEPGFRRKTPAELQADHERWLADVRATTKAETARCDQERAARAASYDPKRARARLALLEQQAVLAMDTEELDGMATGEWYPLMPEGDRQRRLAELNRNIGHTSALVDELSQQAGDVETVADEHGWLPSERRDLALTLFKARRVTEVRELRERVTARRAELGEAKGRSARAPLRDALRKDTRRLEFLETIPPLTASDMCSECVTPAGWHGFRFELSDACPERGPCPAWPLWQQRVHEARQILLSSAAKKAAPPAPPKPQPLAVIPSDLPIEEVITRLSAIQASHPGATVRRGSRNRWEVWPPQPAQS